MRFAFPGCRPLGLMAVLAVSSLLAAPAQAQISSPAQISSYAQSMAEAAAEDQVVAEFYRGRAYATLWTGPQDAPRRAVLLAAFADAPLHGLPVQRYDAAALAAAFRGAVTEGDRGRLEIRMTQAFLAFARDLHSGVLEPARVDPGILREVTPADPAVLLRRIETPDLRGFLRDLAPEAAEYAPLMKEKLRLEAEIAAGGWEKTVISGPLAPGANGADVVALRNRLQVLGYLARSVTQTYDREIVAAVLRFQLDQGFNGDGTAGAGTIEALNTHPVERLKAVVVAMERLRWLGDAPRGARHIWVNQPDFTARIVDHGRVTFQTRVVIGKNVPDQRSPEFSDLMEYMVINPSWGVPRSILVKEYLPLLQRNSGAVGHLQVIDGRGRVVPRSAVNFAAYSAKSFPYGLRQPPSDGNALGKVKFMFPNANNIYLHDTPSKSLFANEVRAYSHGCIRVADPMDLAYALLAPQSADPKAEFAGHLETGRETSVPLAEKIPVHLVYFTAWPTAKGGMSYRRDVYGRDAAIFDALTEAGVVLPGVQG